LRALLALETAGLSGGTGFFGVIGVIGRINEGTRLGITSFSLFCFPGGSFPGFAAAALSGRSHATHSTRPDFAFHLSC
jgi:hypothetical protein